MSLRDFWINVRTGSRLRTPPTIVDSPKLEASEIERVLRAEATWVTSHSVAGFDEADFPFLSEPDRKQLADLVARFRAVTARVSPVAPATEQQIEEALPLFLRIIQILEFDRYGDAEAYRLGKEIENVIKDYRPGELAELWFNTRLDHTGDPGIWMWAILSDETAGEDQFFDDDQFFAATERVRKLLDPVARQAAPDRWPYIHFRTVAEQAEIMEAQANCSTLRMGVAEG